MPTTEKRAAEVWREVVEADAEFGAHLRDSVHQLWPELSSTLDYPELEVNVGDVWHGDDGLPDIRRRQSVRETWPALGHALDYAEHPTWDLSLVTADHIDQAVANLRQPAGQVIIRWPAVVTVAAAGLVGIALGMALEFALLSGAVL